MRHPNRPPSTLWVGALLLTAGTALLPATDFGSTDVPLFETAEWSFTDTSVSGEAFWHYGTVVFTHTASGAVRRTTTFYDGGDTWRFRFFATRRGEWTFASTGGDPDQAGHSGTVMVGAPLPGKLGPIVPRGDRYVRRDGDGGLRAAYLQIFQYGGSYDDETSDWPGLRLSNYAAMSPSEREALLAEHLDAAEQHGMTGVFALTDSWDVDATGLPNLERFRLFEWYIGRLWERNLHLHSWMWSENSELTRWSAQDFYRYMAARTGPLGSWSADITWDSGGPDGNVALSMGSGLDSWAEMITPHTGWTKMLAIRKQSNPLFGYVSNDLRFDQVLGTQSIEGYPTGRPQDPYHVVRWLRDELPHGKPHFFMRRHWLKRASSITADHTVRAIWEYMLAGGATDDWGAGGDAPMPYPGYERLAHIKTFLHDGDRCRLDLEPVDGKSSAYMLANPTTSHVLLYQRNTDQISVDLSGSPSGLAVVALDTEATTYQEIDLGSAGGGNHTIDLPSGSNWAVAIGDFTATYRVRAIDAGRDRFIRDTDGSGAAGVALSATPDAGLSDIRWSWPGGSANGQDVLIDLPLGEHAITCTATNPDGPDPSDIVYVRVVDQVESGILYVVGESTWYQGEDLTIGPAVSADNSWSTTTSGSKDDCPTSQGAYLRSGGDSSVSTPWSDARDAAVTVDMASGRALKVYARTFGGGSEQNLMVGLDGAFHGYGSTHGTFRKPWVWTVIEEPLFIPAGRHQLQFRHARNADLDCFHLGSEHRLPTGTGGTSPSLVDEDAPGGGGGGSNRPPTITAGPAADPDPVTGTSTTVSVSAEDPDGDDALLTAQWSVLAQPGGAPTPSFADNGTQAALSTTASFAAAGSYTFEVVITDAGGAQTSGQVEVVVDQTATSMEVTP